MSKSLQLGNLITPAIVKSRFLACLESKFLNFYPSRSASLSFVPNFPHFEVRFCPALLAKRSKVSSARPVVVDDKKPPFNPFLPFEQNLLVSELDNNYVLIFNKFCVVPEHLLIITKEFVRQDVRFSTKDFAAVKVVLDNLSDVKPLAFYNSGPDAGASQRHRHFQVIPTSDSGSPIEAQIVCNSILGDVFLLPSFSSFKHGIIRRKSDEDANDDCWQYSAYCKLRKFCGIEEEPYNLLWTSDWMLMVPRRKEFTDDGENSLNAMTFAGYFLVMNEANLHHLNFSKWLSEVTFSTL